MWRDGSPTAEIARAAGIPRSTVRYWIAHDWFAGDRRRGDSCDNHLVTEDLGGPYSYLLGFYLGDGCLSLTARGVYRLRVTLDTKYPGIIDDCSRAMAIVMPDNKVGRVSRIGCLDVYSYSKHWACLFPQHGAGPKHLRPIILADWQVEAALDRHPHLLLRGLIQSDGWRGTNRVPGGYEYPRYMFTNRSADIRSIFAEACERMAITCRPCGDWQVAVSRRRDVARMDAFIGAKR